MRALHEARDKARAAARSAAYRVRRRVRSGACRMSDHAQRWTFDALHGTFSPLANASMCLELTSSRDTAERARVAPCIRSAGALRAGHRTVAERLAAGQLFEWDQTARQYCISFLSTMGFHMRRCVRTTTMITSVTVAFQSDDAMQSPASCLRAPGPFRMLEPATCARDDRMQRWSLEAATGRLRLAGEPSQCLRFSLDARKFFAWTCDNAGTFQAAPQQGGLNDGLAYCTNSLAGGQRLTRSACLTVAEDQ